MEISWQIVLSDRACPFTLRQHDLVRVVDEVLVGKHLEKNAIASCSRVNAVGWRLIRPAQSRLTSKSRNALVTAEKGDSINDGSKRLK